VTNPQTVKNLGYASMAQQLNRFLEERLRVALQGDLGVQGRIPLTVLAWLFVDLRAGIAPRVTQTALDRSLVMRGSLESCSLPRGPLQPLSKSENAEQFALFLPEHDLSRWVLGWELLVGDQVDLVEPRVGRDACKAPTPVESFARSAHRNGKGRKSFSITLRWASSHIDILISREQILPVSWAHLRFEFDGNLVSRVDSSLFCSDCARRDSPLQDCPRRMDRAPILWDRKAEAIAYLSRNGSTHLARIISWSSDIRRISWTREYVSNASPVVLETRSRMVHFLSPSYPSRDNRLSLSRTSRNRIVLSASTVPHRAGALQVDRMGVAATLRPIAKVSDRIPSILCRICNRSFTRTTHLRRHERAIHERAAGFSCQHCGRQFSQRANLTRHVRVVHQREKAWTCETCGLGFSFKQNMVRHWWRVHGLAFSDVESK